MFQSDHRSVMFSEKDHQQLSHLAATAQLGEAERLRAKLSSARILPKKFLPSYVVSIGSRVTLMDTESGFETAVTLVFPQEADRHNLKISVLSDLGITLAGLRTGITVYWHLPKGGVRSFKIVNVRQPSEQVAYGQ